MIEGRFESNLGKFTSFPCGPDYPYAMGVASQLNWSNLGQFISKSITPDELEKFNNLVHTVEHKDLPTSMRVFSFVFWNKILLYVPEGYHVLYRFPGNTSPARLSMPIALPPKSIAEDSRTATLYAPCHNKNYDGTVEITF